MTDEQAAPRHHGLQLEARVEEQDVAVRALPEDALVDEAKLGCGIGADDPEGVLEGHALAPHHGAEGVEKGDGTHDLEVGDAA